MYILQAHLDRGPPLTRSNSGDNTCPPGFGIDNSKITLLFLRRVMSWQNRRSILHHDALPSQLLRVTWQFFF